MKDMIVMVRGMYAGLIAILLTAALMASPTGAQAAQDKAVGAFVIVQGKTYIQRAGKTYNAGRKTAIELNDFVMTDERARAKLLFIDESMLTLGPKTKASIEKFVYSRAGGGASIFNLLDGKMRTIVGKTKFEVHTSTSVAAARGTIIDFFVGQKNGRPFTLIKCLEGTVEVRNADPKVPGIVRLPAGQAMVVFKGEQLPRPKPADMKGLLKKPRREDQGKKRDDKAGKGDGRKGGGPGGGANGEGGEGDAGEGDAGEGDAGEGDAGEGDAGEGDAGEGDAGEGDTGEGSDFGEFEGEGDSGEGADFGGMGEDGAGSGAGSGGGGTGGGEEILPPVQQEPEIKTAPIHVIVEFP